MQEYYRLAVIALLTVIIAAQSGTYVQNGYLPPSPQQPTGYPTRMPNQIATGTKGDLPKHRALLYQLFQQVVGPNFTSPGLKQLAFLSTTNSLPLKSHVRDYQQTKESSMYPQITHDAYRLHQNDDTQQFELPQFIQPPPPAGEFNYYN